MKLYVLDPQQPLESQLLEPSILTPDLCKFDVSN